MTRADASGKSGTTRENRMLSDGQLSCEMQERRGSRLMYSETSRLQQQVRGDGITIGAEPAGHVTSIRRAIRQTKVKTQALDALKVCLKVEKRLREGNVHYKLVARLFFNSFEAAYTLVAFVRGE
jgi:hypothetical protein